MEADMAISFDDLWTPGRPLPGKEVLLAVTNRCGDVWNFPELAQQVRLGYNPRLRSTLGRALLDEARVELNTRLLREHPAHLIPTFVHELAHVAVYLRYGNVAPHGIQFRTLMSTLALPAAATHNLPTGHLRRKRRRYLYLHRCSDCSYSFVARSIRRGYYCIACGPEMMWEIFRMPNTAAVRKRLAEIANPSSNSLP